ncbi:phosphoadenylyl-sulfate reductase [Puniceicoccales bacterium CK1056]|uniref:Phosphoadenosine 5'-phosphosulfate reductase n=1 Tax=Oceanipulchritudo coccoides TaxID=2706888 RepID=A0A6B2M338_9BACT|nr:phosphoadenylyl-sulfate reductase [Oceanipulchritudo coccoides]NDV62514.1 phosphoadenylyl-sulfate reductase [Oceanipulchritudo coccoides]
MIKTEASLKGEESAWLEAATAEERVGWALEQFGEKVVLSTSFGIQSAVMLHLVTQIRPEIPVIFVDTGYLFPETYQFVEELVERMQLNLKVYAPLWTAARQEAIHGKRWEKGLEELEAYNRDNKVEPMNRALKDLGAEAWISGLRRVQSSTRAQLQVVQKQKRTTKIHPIIDWSEKQVYEYMKANELPFHPLWEQGYVSVGDWHSTAPLGAGMDAESTRFGGLKRECGLHEKSDQQDWQI